MLTIGSLIKESLSSEAAGPPDKKISDGAPPPQPLRKSSRAPWEASQAGLLPGGKCTQKSSQ